VGQDDYSSEQVIDFLREGKILQPKENTRLRKFVADCYWTSRYLRKLPREIIKTDKEASGCV
jgi:hypothetical protein